MKRHNMCYYSVYIYLKFLWPLLVCLSFLLCLICLCLILHMFILFIHVCDLFIYTNTCFVYMLRIGPGG
jgi:hypothetical protein